MAVKLAEYYESIYVSPDQRIRLYKAKHGLSTPNN